MKNKIKMFFGFTASLIGTFLISASVFASDITVTLNGAEIYFPDQTPEIVDGRTLVPLRGVFDSMGFDVEWNADDRSVTISNAIKDIVMTENIKRISTDSKTIDIDAAPKIMGGRLMIPLRAVAESVDAKVDWDQSTKTVSILYGKNNYDDSIHNIGLDEQQYMKTIISLKEEMRELSKDFPDAILTEVAKTGNFYEAADTKVSEAQYEALEDILDRLDAAEPTEELAPAHDELKNYTELMRKLIEYSKTKNPKNVLDKENSSFMNDLDYFKQTLEDINSRFTNALIKYFVDHKVLWETIYGDSYIYNFLLY